MKKQQVYTNHNNATFNLIIAILILSNFAFAQEMNIKGKVYDEKGEALMYAQIHFVHNENKVHTQSDENGNYSFANVPIGQYKVIANYIGYKQKEKTITHTNQKDTQLDFYLKPDDLVISDVVVTEKSVATEMEDKGYALETVDVKQLEQSSVQVTEMLNRTAGVKIRQTGGLGSHTHYNINGLSGSSIRIFIDGVPIRAFGSSFSLSSIPSRMIERVDVYKGVVPIELAGDALGGAINVILKNKLSANQLSTSYSFGSFNTHQAELSGSYRANKSGFTLKGSAFYNYSNNDYNVWGNEVYTTNPSTGDISYLKTKRFHDSFQSKGVKVDAGITGKSWVNELLVGVIASDIDRDIQHGATMETVYGARRAYQDTKLVSFQYKPQAFIDERLSLSVFASYSNLKRNNVDTTATIFDWDGNTKPKYDKNGNIIGYFEYITGAEAGQPSLNKDVEDVYSGIFNTKFKINDQHSISANYLYNQFDRNSNDPLRHIDLRFKEDTRFASKHFYGFGYDFNAFDEQLKLYGFYKGYIQNNKVKEFKIANRGTTVELNSENRQVNADGYGFTVSYEPIPNVILLSSAERAFKFPGSRQLFGNLIDNLLPNYSLTPERSNNYNLGVTLGTWDINKHSTRIKFNTFIRDTQDKIIRIIEERGNDEFFSYINDRDYISKGFDIDTYYNYNDFFDISANYSIFNSRFNTQFDSNGTPFAWYKNRQRNAPFKTGNLNANIYKYNLFKPKSKVTFSTNLAYVHWFYRDWEALGDRGKDVIPTQYVLDVGLLYEFPNEKLSIALDGKNILDKQVYDNFALQKPGRASYVKFNYNIF